MKISLKKKIAAAAAAATIIGGAGAALAYWTTTGSGTGSASTGTSTPVNVAQVGSITNLYPGSSAQAVDFSIDNTTTNHQYITTVVITKGAVTGTNIDETHPCTAADFTLVQPTAINEDLTPGVHTYRPSGATLALNNTGANQDGCKGASIALTFAAS